MNRPRVTVVTVNYNMRDGLEKTIRSVMAQTYPNIEYIVVDGASRDGSIDVIKKYAHALARWTSEPDRNLYDAMNKGAAAASGEWVLFMNSGDCFADDDVVADIFSCNLENDDLVYGNVIWRYEGQKFEYLKRAESPETLAQKMHCSHQSLFTRASLMQEYPFDKELLISDYDFLVHCLALNKRFQFIDRTVAVITKGGRSDLQRALVLRQQQQVLRRYGMLTWQWRLKYPFIVAVNRANLWLREKLPTRWARWFLSRKWIRHHSAGN